VASFKQPGHGAPITGLSHVQLMVSDVGASARWYSTVLGLDTLSEDPEIGYVALRHRDAKVVVVLTKGRGPHDPSRGSADEVLDHLAFAVPDGDVLSSWAEHLSEVGIVHDGVVRENGHPSLQLRDPDGISIELVAPRSTDSAR
jgi:glyoxylase I family protein